MLTEDMCVSILVYDGCVAVWGVKEYGVYPAAEIRARF